MKGVQASLEVGTWSGGEPEQCSIRRRGSGQGIRVPGLGCGGNGLLILGAQHKVWSSLAPDVFNSVDRI